MLLRRSSVIRRERSIRSMAARVLVMPQDPATSKESLHAAPLLYGTRDVLLELDHHCSQLSCKLRTWEMSADVPVVPVL